MRIKILQGNLHQRNIGNIDTFRKQGYRETIPDLMLALEAIARTRLSHQKGDSVGGGTQLESKDGENRDRVADQADNPPSRYEGSDRRHHG